MIEMYDIRTDRVEIKFNVLLNASHFINSNFVLMNISLATPTPVANPFKAINLTRDYYSISRTLELYWNVTLPANTNFQLIIKNQKTILDIDELDETIAFSTVGLVFPSTESIPTRAPIDVEDYSIKDITPFFADTLSATFPDAFGVVSIKPAPEDAAYLDPSYNEGRIEIYFTDSPAANFISSEYFKVQRKKLMSGISRWETVNALVTSNPDDNFVMLYMPSNDTVPQYGEPDLIYWETGYKYRLRISANIGPATI